jgi:hypothetical protein
MQYFNMYTRHHPPTLEMDLAALNGAAEDYEIEISKLYSIYLNLTPETYTEDIHKKMIYLLDNTLYLRNLIRDLCLSIKKKVSNMKNENIKNQIINEYRTIYWNISRNDALLEELHSLLDPLAKEVNIRSHIYDPNTKMGNRRSEYAFTYNIPQFHPLPEIILPPATSEQSNSTNRNTGSGIRRNRRSRRGGSLASTLFPSFLSALALL